MDGLVECVPNLSEGSRRETIDRIARAVDRVPGAVLLDRTADLDHDRSVLTFAGPAAAVFQAMQDVATQAIARIDMRRQHGRHPRVGAVDVVPFVPLGQTRMEECIELARDFGSWVADRYELPVFLYAHAATRAEHRVLADIRRPGFEGLDAALTRAQGGPDLGPRRAHPTAGASCVGARPPLIAWNVQLESDELAIVQRIAATIRERGGGLPAVQALGIPLPSMGCTQVSMNLLDHERTPMWLVLERIRELAAAADVGIRDTELVGLAPVGAFLATAEHAGVPATLPVEARVAAAEAWLGIRDATPDMALELRLAAYTTAVAR